MKSKGKIKILSFNANLLPALSFASIFSDGHGYQVERLQELVKMISSYDIILFQEVFSSPFIFPSLFCKQSWLRKVSEKIGFKYIIRGKQPSVLNLIKEGKWTDAGLLILSKYLIVEKDDIIFQQAGTHLDKGASKGCLYAKIKIGDCFINVFNLHLQANHFRDSFRNNMIYNQIRAQQLEEVRQFVISKCHNDHNAYIIGGDFNIDSIPGTVTDSIGITEFRESSEGETNEYKIMVNIIDPNGKIKDLLKEKYGYHPSTRPPRDQIGGGIQGIFIHKYPQRLDYVFYHPPSQPHDGSILEPCVEETDIVTFQVNDKPFKFLSDHYGIETHLTYTKDLKRTGIHDEIPFKLEWTNWGLYIKMIFLLIIIHIEFFWGYRLWIILLTIFIVFNIMYIIEYCIGNQEFSDEIILTPINPWRKKGHRKSLSTSSETFIHKALGPVNPFEETHTLYENFQF